MKQIKLITSILLVMNLTMAFGQKDSTQAANKRFPNRMLSIEPAIGINPMPMSDIVLSNVIQFNVKRHFSIVSRTSLAFNTAFARDFNYIHTDYNYSFSQTFGIGTSFYTKYSSHTFSLMAGFKYDATKETLNNPSFERVSVASSAMSPDLGFMYNLKIGRKKYFFNFRTYVPLYPFPFKTTDVSAIEGNLSNISLEFGLGIRLK